MLNQKTHNYILYLVRRLNKKYNKSIILFYNPKCNRSNIIFNEKKNQHLFTYGDKLITNAINEKSHYRDHLRYVISHELGHVVHNLPYETFNDKVENEYSAERFALNYLKENYQKTYVWCCKVGFSMVHDSKWATCKSESHYRKAWERVVEYN